MSSHPAPTNALIPANNTVDGNASTQMLIPAYPVEERESNSEDAGKKGGFTPLAFVQSFFRVWRTAVLVGMVLGLIGLVLIWFMRPPLHTASAFLRVHASEQTVLDPSSGSRQGSDGKMFMDTQAALIKSRKVINAALKEEKTRNLPLVRMQAKPAQWLEKQLKAEYVKGTEILLLTLSDRVHVEDLSLIVEAIQNNYLSVIVEGEKEQRKALLADMELIQNKWSENLRSQREKLRALANDLKTSDSNILTIKQKNLYEEYTQLKLAVLTLDSKIRDLQIKQASQGALVPVNPAADGKGNEKDKGNPGGLAKGPPVPQLLGGGTTPIPAVEQLIDNDPGIIRQLAEVSKLEMEIQQIESVQKNQDNKVRKSQMARLATAKDFLEKLRSEKRKALTARYQEMRQQEIAGRLQESDAELKISMKVREELKQEVDKKRIEVESIGVGSAELEALRSEIEQTEQVFKDLRRQKERLQVEMESKVNQRISPLLKDVEPAEVLSKMTRYIEALGGSLAGLGLGILGVTLNEFRKRKIYTPQCMDNMLGIRVMGTTPNTKNNGMDRRIQQQLILDSVDSLRTRILQSAPEGTSRVLMVTSAWSGEGKTTLSNLLVASIARAGRRTLLVDCDLRCPSLHEILDLKLSPGTSEVLTGTNTLEESIQTTSIPGVFLLAAGQFTSAAVSTLGRQNHLKKIFNQMREQFDFVVVDTSPLLAVPDTLMICSCVDGVILSVRSGVSQAPHVNSAYENLREIGVPFVGAVVNGINDKTLYGKNIRYSSARSIE